MKRIRSVPFSLLLVVAVHAHLEMDVHWNGDYRQLLRRLKQVYRFSKHAAVQSRQIYAKCEAEARHFIQEFKKSRQVREFAHLYPYLDPNIRICLSPRRPNTFSPESSDPQLSNHGGSNIIHRPLTQDSMTKPSFDSNHQGGKGLKVIGRGGSDHLNSGKFRMAISMGLVLAFNCGYINGCCLSGATGTGSVPAVASVTEKAYHTNSALGFASSANLRQLTTQVQVLASYILGSALAGCLNPRPSATSVDSFTTYLREPALIIAGLLLTVSAILAGKSPGSKIYFLLAAMANGLQNSVTSSATAHLCCHRTNQHRTGISSDRRMDGNHTVVHRSRVRVLASLAVAFWTGGILSYVCTQRYGSVSLWIGALVYFLVGSGALQGGLLWISSSYSSSSASSRERQQQLQRRKGLMEEQQQQLLQQPVLQPHQEDEHFLHHHQERQPSYDEESIASSYRHHDVGIQTQNSERIPTSNASSLPHVVTATDNQQHKGLHLRSLAIQYTQ